MDNKAQLLNFLENYGGGLMSFALSLLGNKAEAEDACQEMVVQMLKHWESFEGDRNLKSWAFTILY
ncbi:MAG: sigma factor, partial [Candidatus Saccharicenans sp.]|nr:sigma factor [Candidatus Saccharicenans sp.]